MSLPAILSEMRGDGVQEDELGLNEPEEEEWVHWLGTLANEVVLLNGLELEETMLECLLVLDFLVVSGGVLNGIRDLVLKDLIPKVASRLICEIKTLLGDCLAELLKDPTLKDVETEDGRISNLLIEIGII